MAIITEIHKEYRAGDTITPSLFNNTLETAMEAYKCASALLVNLFPTEFERIKFSIDSDGNLWFSYDGDTPPGLSINESGNLILNIG